jgi:hypothetical protein
LNDPLEAGPIAKRRAILWWTLTIIAALAFFLLALSDTVYELTSPPGPLQIVLRKSYSIVAFAIVGYCLTRAFRLSQRSKGTLYIAFAIALYSLIIEVSQFIGGAQEGIFWNAVDVGCGFIGGYLGAIANKLSSA